MTSYAHASLAAGRWHTLPLAEQLGNAGSEVERALRARTAGNRERATRALDRALELLDLTATDPRLQLHQRREVLRAREQVCRVFYDDVVEPGLAEYLSKYFLQFAVAARSSR